MLLGRQAASGRLCLFWRSDANRCLRPEDLLAGAWTGAYQQAVICSNDTDLEAALATVRKHHSGIRVGLVAPIPHTDHRYIAADLKRHAHCKCATARTHTRILNLSTYRMELTATQHSSAII